MVELLSLSEFEMLLSNFIPGFSKLFWLEIIEEIKFEYNLERKVHIKDDFVFHLEEHLQANCSIITSANPFISRLLKIG